MFSCTVNQAILSNDLAVEEDAGRDEMRRKLIKDLYSTSLRGDSSDV